MALFPAPSTSRTQVSALSQDGGHSSRAPERTRNPSYISLLRPSSAPPHPTRPSCSAPARPQPHPFSGLPPPVQAPEPGSGCGRSAERTTGRREKCFRGNGPRVGVCKLASVPAGAAAAAGLARCAGAGRERRAAAEPAGGRARQVSGLDLELHRENSTGKPRVADYLLQKIGRSQAETRDSWHTCFPCGGP